MNYFTINNTPPSKGPTNIFRVVVNTYAGDADYYQKQTYQFKTPEQLNTFIIEATMVKCQFPSGRGGCNMMFDQSNYFSTENYYECTDPDGHWDWFTSEEDFPYSSDYEQNHTISAITITYFDNDGNSIPVDITVPDSLYEDMSALGKKHRLGDYKIWNTNINSNVRDDEMLATYRAYRTDAIALKLKYLQA